MSFLVWQTAHPPMHAASDPEIDAVRNTDPAIVPDEREAMEDGPPERGAPMDVDPRVRLGMVTRTTASLVIPSEQYAPPWAHLVDTDQIAGDAIPSAGYAASREMAGDFGHGTLPYAIGIAPLIDHELEFGRVYFASNDRDIAENATARDWGIQPGNLDQRGLAGDSAYAAQRMIEARHAAETSKAYDLTGLWDLD